MGPFYAPIASPKWVRFARQSPYANIATESCCSFPNEDILNAIQTAGYTGKIPKAVENK